MTTTQTKPPKRSKQATGNRKAAAGTVQPPATMPQPSAVTPLAAAPMLGVTSVTCNRKELLAVVNAASKAVSARSTLPILSNILVRTETDRLRVTANDLEIGLELVVPATVNVPGDFTVNARVFQDILAAFGDSPIDITADAKDVVTIRCGSSEYKLSSLPAAEFPVLSDVQPACTIQVDAEVLSECIKRTIFAVEENEMRYNLSGVLFTLTENGDLNLVGTDSHRLVVQECATIAITGDVQVIVPKKAMIEVLRLCPDRGTVLIDVAPNRMLVKIGDDRLVTNLLDGKFPNYSKVIPESFDKSITLPTAMFSQSLARAAIVARDNNDKVALETKDGVLHITAESGFGRAHEEVDIIQDGDDIRIAFCAKYLSQALAVIQDEAVILSLNGPGQAARIVSDAANDGFTYIVMPMHLD